MLPGRQTERSKEVGGEQREEGSGKRRKRRKKEAKGREGEGHAVRKRPIEGEQARNQSGPSPQPLFKQSPVLMILDYSPRPFPH